MRLSAEKTKKVEIPDDPDGGYVVIKALSLEKLSEIEAKSSVLSVVGNEARMTISSYERENGVAKACLKDWGNLFDVNGDPLKFTAGNVEKSKHFQVDIDNGTIRFFTWVDSEHAKFRNELKGPIEEAQGN